MRKIFLSALIILTAHTLFALDIWINGEFYSTYTREELKDYAYPDKTGREGELLLSRIVPLFDDVIRVEAYGGRNRIVLEEPEGILRTLTLVFTGGNSYLLRDDYRFENPERIDIWGSRVQEESLRVILPEQDNFTLKRLELFCHYHNLTFEGIPSPDPAKELMNRIYQQKPLPHLIIYPDESHAALSGRIGEKRDYYFTVTALFSRRDLSLRPMDLDNILAESSHTYSWNSYDFPTFSLFTSYYGNRGAGGDEALKQALVLNRSLKEMGILRESTSPALAKTDFFLAETGTFDLMGKICYPDFIRPLYNYYCLSPLQEGEASSLVESAMDYLLSPDAQRIIGWEKNGFYPVLSPEKNVNPSDPCLILLNRYRGDNLRLVYDDAMVTKMDKWLTLSRLAINSSLSIDDLISSTADGGERRF